MNSAKYLFVDIETTGLSPDADLILELGMIVTDSQLNVLDRFDAPIYKGEGAMAVRMDAFVTEMHTKSGLLASVKKNGMTQDSVEEQGIEFVKENFGTVRPIVAGNSVHFDVSFLKSGMPKLADLFHYQQLNVSSVLEALKIKGVQITKIQFPHRALADCEASIELLKSALAAVKGV